MNKRATTTGKKSTQAAAGKRSAAVEQVYAASSINDPEDIPEPGEEKKNRRTQEEMQECREAIRKAAAAEHPLTLRRLFYILVSTRSAIHPERGIYQKTEAEYGNLGRLLCEMREDGSILWEWVIDNVRKIDVPATFSDLSDVLSAALYSYKLDPWLDQPQQVYVMTEKNAIAGIMRQITYPYVVPLCVVVGFSSRTFLHDIAERIAAARKPAVVLYLGDHDGSGLKIAKANERLLHRYAPKAKIDFQRIAVTEEQIYQYDLPTRPGKDNSHSKDFSGPSVEVDALPTAVLSTLVRDGIESHLDRDRYDRVQRREEQDFKELQKFIQKHRRSSR
jgi:hypothetical protein